MKIQFDEEGHAPASPQHEPATSAVEGATATEAELSGHQFTLRHFDSDEQDEDDGAPVAESFHAAKERVVQENQAQKLSLAKQREETRRKRREREERRAVEKQQAEAKRASKKAKREEQRKLKAESTVQQQQEAVNYAVAPVQAEEPLPADLLAALPAEPLALTTSSSTSNAKHLRGVELTGMDESALLKTTSTNNSKSSRKRQRGPAALTTSKDLLQGKLRVVVLQRQQQEARKQAIPEKLLTFKEQHFFGERVRRASDGSGKSRAFYARDRRNLPLRFATGTGTV